MFSLKKLAAAALFFALLILTAASNAQELSPPIPGGTVVHCFDGDTFRMRDRRIVRLAGIDAPETAHGANKAQYYAKEAKNILTEMLRNKKVSLESPGLRLKDHVGRILAEARLEDGSSVNEKLVEQGAAFFYPHPDLTPEFQDRLRELQSEAIQERRGLWAHLLSLPLAQENYIGNRNSLRFFPANCPDVQHIKPRNRVHFGTLMDAFLAGYAPARVCIFWPGENG